MKLHNDAQPIETSGVTESSSFSIAMNAKAFKVLSDTLYMNKIGSIVREISCNAYDAHVMAGKKEVPFEIHLPTAFEPWFAVRDFGTGLSPEAIRSVFTVYFESTKDQSNDAIGAFGLGAKTPLAYTDQFTVTSVVDFTRRIYSVFKTASGIPDIALMDESNTTDGNGVEIKLSAKREDFHRFSDEVRSQLEYFIVKPTITNGSVSWSADQREWTFEGTTGRFDNKRAVKKKIVQGNVAYDLDINTLNSSSISQNYANEVKFFSSLSHHCVELVFPIGQIGVTASREGVEYDNNTVTNIFEAIKKLREEFAVGINVKFNSFNTTWEKLYFVQSDYLILNTIDVAHYLNSVYNRRGNAFEVNLAPILRKEIRVNGMATYENRAFLSRVSIHNYNNKRTRISVDSRLPVDDKNKIVILVRDKNTLAERKTSHYLKTNPQYISVYELKAGSVPLDTVVKELRSSTENVINIIKMSEIELPETLKGPAVRNAPNNYYAHTSGYENTIRSASWDGIKEETIDDIEDKSVYLVHDGYSVNYSDLSRIINLNNLIKNPVNIIAISAAKEDKAKANCNLMDIEKFQMKALAEFETERIAIEKVLRRGHLRDFLIHNQFHHKIKIVDKIVYSAPNHAVVKTIKAFNKLIAAFSANDMRKLSEKAQYMKILINKSLIERRASVMIDTLKKYPLLEHMNHYSVRDLVKPEDVLQYVQAIDNLQT